MAPPPSHAEADGQAGAGGQSQAREGGGGHVNVGGSGDGTGWSLVGASLSQVPLGGKKKRRRRTNHQYAMLASQLLVTLWGSVLATLLLSSPPVTCHFPPSLVWTLSSVTDQSLPPVTFSQGAHPCARACLRITAHAGCTVKFILRMSGCSGRPAVTTIAEATATHHPPAPPPPCVPPFLYIQRTRAHAHVSKQCASFRKCILQKSERKSLR